MNKFSSGWVVMAGGLAAILAAGAASATAPSDVLTETVHYSKSSLTSDAGVHSLYRRLVNAAKQVCPDEVFRDLGAQARARECRSQAVARAVEQINNSQLAALYATDGTKG